jgi:DNA-binding LytR/AlgR family response regulator
MKHTTVIDPHREEEVVIHAKKKTKEIEELESYLDRMSAELTGYGEEGRMIPLRPAEIHCFTVEDGKVFTLTDKEKLAVRLPLYAIEEMLSADFIRINQSCLGNIRKIARFEASIGGALMVIFGNGHRDYVSRRQLRNVKERMHIKL